MWDKEINSKIVETIVDNYSWYLMLLSHQLRVGILTWLTLLSRVMTTDDRGMTSSWHKYKHCNHVTIIIVLGMVAIFTLIVALSISYVQVSLELGRGSKKNKKKCWKIPTLCWTHPPIPLCWKIKIKNFYLK